MNILIDKKKVVIEGYTAHVHNVSYTYPPQKDSVTFIFNNRVTKTVIVSDTQVNGVQMTFDNIDDLMSDLFFLEIDIENITGLKEDLAKKADLVNGYVPSYQLPSYVDDVIEGELVSETEFDVEGLIITGEQGKIYIDNTTNLTYRWSGSKYVEISKSLALGDTEFTAYRGDRGKIAYDHSQMTSGNPHKVTKADVGLSNVDNTSDANKPVSTAQQAAIEYMVSDLRIGGENLIQLPMLKFGYLSKGVFNAFKEGSLSYDYTCDIFMQIPNLYKHITCTIYYPYLKPTGQSGMLSFYDSNKQFISENVWCEGNKTTGISTTSIKTIEIPETATYYRYSIPNINLICKLEFGTYSTDFSISTISLQSQITALSNKQ